jgi:two-component system chemotaxis response regulator CheY
MKRCLVADSSEVVRKVARHFLEGLGFEVCEADGAQAMLDMWRRKSPDIIMLDWHLPGMTTIEILSALRFGGGSTKRPFVLYCTADNEPVELTRAFAAGIDAYIMKPFDRQSFAEKFTETGLAA